MFKTAPQDNSRLLLKTLLRKSLLELRATDRGAVLDLFASRAGRSPQGCTAAFAKCTWSRKTKNSSRS